MVRKSPNKQDDYPQVWVLRRFRGYKLNRSVFGRLFIKAYYAVSPTLAKWFGNTKWFKRIWGGKAVGR